MAGVAVRPWRPVSSERMNSEQLPEGASIAIASPTDFICVVRSGFSVGNFSKPSVGS